MFAFCGLLFAAAPGFAQISLTDDAGREVRLGAPAKRVIALYGAANECLAAMGLADRLVARTQADDYPPEIKSLPVIGTHMRPNVEFILNLKPDLVVQIAGREEGGEAARQLADHGLAVATFKVDDFPGLFSLITRLGLLTGEPGAAASLNEDLQRRLENVRGLVKDLDRPKVFFEARYPNLLAAASGSFPARIIEAAGGEIVPATPERFVRLSEEELLRLNPDFYLVQQGPMNQKPGELKERENFSLLKAVRDGRTVQVSERLFSRPGPRSLEALEQLAGLLHPEIKSKLEEIRNK